MAGEGEHEGMADVKAVVRELHDRRLSPRRIRLAAMEDVADAIASHTGWSWGGEHVLP